MAWPKESNPTKPRSRLKAQAKSAKHITFIRNTGYMPSAGPSRKKATITPKAMRCAPISRVFTAGRTALISCGSFLCAEQACRPDGEHDGSPHEDHGLRGL